ncbi:sirtuin 2 (silent mating type information regulation homolog) 2 (cerevisiae) [Phaffia rhodozyma]|uniref:Sirtuin 2 (Silent mating type information regulation homolog) 2 ( cerevisiae) n=1 Tax=Phaffia rhodozyma TaxID=264483 RepID=A0A0F7SG63_PHARH|nr:sirtuin 2 (silent mating type information regulation homolog) 2 (cerevisiae) [Phaffia rhodozyma]
MEPLDRPTIGLLPPEAWSIDGPSTDPSDLTASFKFSTTLEAHESDVKAVAAPRDDLLLTASRDEAVCFWGKSSATDREYKLSGVGLGHGSYVNSVAYIHPTSNHPNGLVASGSLSSLILIHEAPTKGSWASSVDGEEGFTPGRDAIRPSEQPLHTLVGHSHNVCSLSISAPSWAKTAVSVACDPIERSKAPNSTTATTSSPNRSRPTSKELISEKSSSKSTLSGFPLWNYRPGQDDKTRGPGDLTKPSPSSYEEQTDQERGLNCTTGQVPEEDQLLISTSWDCTARVWSTSTWKEILCLEGHKEAVWAGLVVEGKHCGRKENERSFLTAGADKLIIHWDSSGRPIRTFKGSTDCVRGLTILPDNEFASCSNDGNIHIWAFSGELVAILTGHISFVYSVCLLPNGDLASSGEDHCVRIWREGKPIQTILHPAISVWSVASLPNGDILTGASDYAARIFSRDPARQADPELLAAYEEAVIDAVKSPMRETSSKLNPTKFSLKVDVADDQPNLELEFTPSEPARMAASRFVKQHELPATYVDRIESFLNQQLGAFISPAPSPSLNKDEPTGFFDSTSPSVPDTYHTTAADQIATIKEERIKEKDKASESCEEVGKDRSDEEDDDDDDDEEDDNGDREINETNGCLSELEERSPVVFLSDDQRSLKGFARLIAKAKNVVVMTGAGCSTNAGIPDFRSPDTGLFHNLEKYKLPEPESIFELNFFRSNPAPFYELAKELYPGKFLPTLTHFFIRLLQKHGHLRRVFTQNIDTLERISGIDSSFIVEAHGSFATSSCIDCHKPVDSMTIEQHVRSSRIPYCKSCGGLIKPDITFYGESLPDRFFDCIRDMSECDLLIVMGTSLKVHPFASLVDRVHPTTPRMLINNEIVCQARFPGDEGFGFKRPVEKGGRDVLVKGDCDSGCRSLAKELGWETELDELLNLRNSQLRKEWNLDSTKPNISAVEEVDQLSRKMGAQTLQTRD